MKIAQLAPIAWRTPPQSYGPWELVASVLTEELVARGHDVTLFATGDSVTSAKLDSVVSHGYEEDRELSKEAQVWQYLHVAHCFSRANEFDVIHSHCNYLPLPFSGLVKPPVVTTMHSGTVEFGLPSIFEMYRQHTQTNHYVAISNAARHPELNYAATIYHGIDTTAFPLGDGAGGYLLFMGRIHPDKGTAEAVQIAKKSGRELVIAGLIADQEYFNRAIVPSFTDEAVKYVGLVGGDQKIELLTHASALLAPIQFPEPFGLSLVEAMACGTPVIAFSQGSVPEVVESGVTGFIVATVEEAVSTVHQLEALSRQKCRERVERLFSVDTMVTNYLNLYEQLVN